VIGRRLLSLAVTAVAVTGLLFLDAPAWASDKPGRLNVVWHPSEPRIGDVAWVQVPDTRGARAVEGSVAGRSLSFFPYGDGYAALIGFDLDGKAGPQVWRVAVVRADGDPLTRQGRLKIRSRSFSVQHLTLPSVMVDLDPETERRAAAEGERLRALTRMITPERLWRGRFTRPVAGESPGTGFGARRIINGQPRAAHSGTDYAAPRGTPVVAVNDGRVALVGDYFFPGRFVAIDHGLGLYTLYFHLDAVSVTEDERVTRGQTVGAVGSTGRATGPHLHFAAQLGSARIDPAMLLGLDALD